MITMREYKSLLEHLAADGKWKVYFIVKFLAGTDCRASELAKLEKAAPQMGNLRFGQRAKSVRL